MLEFSFRNFLFGFTAASLLLNTDTMLFSATVQLRRLLITQKAVIDNLDKFIDGEEMLFLLLRRFRDTIQTDHARASTNTQYYIENPINSFKLIKRLTVDVRYVMDKLDLFDVLNSTSTLRFPVDEDLKGASRALVRLQETYQLRTEDMANGKLSNITYSSPMLSGDCFAVGRVLYNVGQHYHSNLWFEQTLNKLKADSLESTKAKRYVYEFIANNNYEMDDLEEGLSWLDKIIAEFSNDEHILERREMWMKELTEKKISGQPTSFLDCIVKKDFNDPKTEEIKSFEVLCRDGSQLTEDMKKRFKCRYDTESHTHLKIAPFKVEEAYLNPDILVYHNVISDADIEHLKVLVSDKLEPGFVCGADADGNPVPKLSSLRISQVSWIKDSDDATVNRLSRRAEHMSRLSIETAEPMQVGIYGMGGYYTPHYDFTLKRRIVDDFSPNTGDRIATVLFYLSDEVQGGATVFTRLGLYLTPLKGAAVVWRNLLPSAEPDMRTVHGACPVLFGSKWVVNKWLHAAGQEFTAPCGLEP